MAFVWINVEHTYYFRFDKAPNYLLNFITPRDYKFALIFNKKPRELIYNLNPNPTNARYKTVCVLSGRPKQRNHTHYILVSEADMRQVIPITTAEGLVFLRPMIEQAFPNLLSKIDTYLLFQ
jgi:hypothetical protein